MNPDFEAPDDQLAASAVAGDERAFARLIARHKDGLYRFIRRYTGNPDEAYDLLQDTLAAAWTALKRYDAARSFPTWLRSIALNKCRDWSRRRAVRRWLTRSDPLDGQAGMNLTDDAPSPEAAVLDQQRLSRLDRAVANLPQGLKEPLILTALEELSHEEVGRILGLTAKAVELRVYRARKALAEALALNEV
ncbi:MAG: RNA polymerase sigma factor [Caulobacterales bacterium]|nr:RNA polymerase sigma factor [Caulobacterales bacterium]